MSPDSLTNRALAAYFRAADKDDSAIYPYPSEAASGVEEHDGLQYVVLRNTNGVLAVYRVRAMTGC